MPQVCCAVDIMGDTRVLFKCAMAVRVRLCAVRAVHVWHPANAAIPRHSARTCVVGWKKLRHSASVRLTCMPPCHNIGGLIAVLESLFFNTSGTFLLQMTPDISRQIFHPNTFNPTVILFFPSSLILLLLVRLSPNSWMNLLNTVNLALERTGG